MSKEGALYMYAIGRHDRLRKLLAGHEVPRGVQHGTPLNLIAQGELAAVVSEVPLNRFGEGQFEENLKDPMWAAETVMRHEKVTEFLASKSTVVPLRFGVMYSTSERIRAMLEARASHLKKVLKRLENREEWALTVFVDKKKLHQQMPELSPRLAEMQKRVQSASPGRAYLLEKKLDSLRAAESKTEARRVVQAIRSVLEATSESTKDLPIRDVESRQDPPVVGKLSFLLDRTNLKNFRRAAEKLAKQYGLFGFSLELTGPWPPYNFSDD
jgi:hypothetical protein